MGKSCEIRRREEGDKRRRGQAAALDYNVHSYNKLKSRMGKEGNNNKDNA